MTSTADASPPGNRFLGIGISCYENHRRLPAAVADVHKFLALLRPAFQEAPLDDPTEADVSVILKGIVDSMASGGDLIAYWSGHGIETKTDRLRLLARDSSNHPVQAGFAVTEFVGKVAASGASQILVIIDACFAGEGASAAVQVTADVQQARPPDADFSWAAVLTACSDQDARDGVFGERLRALVQDGPTGEQSILAYGRFWARHEQRISPDIVCRALIADWDPTQGQRPVLALLATGESTRMIPNPRWEPDAPAQVVEHLLQAARGGPAEARSWFTGRQAEVDLVVSWVTARVPGSYVVTGSAGTGKSAITGRLVSMSVPTERERLIQQAPVEASGLADPRLNAVDAHAHARALTADQLAAMLDAGLSHAQILPHPDHGTRSANELIGAVERAARIAGDSWQPPVVVVDGVDEARGEALTIAKELLVRLARWTTLIISTREVPATDPTEPGLLALLSPANTLNLDDLEVAARGRAAIRDYILARLSDVAAS